jgi:membrane associated rhomboid family serine protease
MIPLRDSVRSRTFPVVNWLLIATNVVIFLWLASLGPDADALVGALALVPARLLYYLDLPQALTLVTSMFLHGGWAHLIGNMLALYIFGDNIEDRLGHIPYLIFYLAAGIIAAVVHIAFNTASPVPTVGASGAISGVLGAYLVLYPRAQVYTLVLVFILPWFVQIPAVVYLGFWFASQLLNGTFAVLSGVQAFGGVAWWAHVGGFATGLVVGLAARGTYTRRAYVDEYYPW